jgi:hypothetical protein
VGVFGACAGRVFRAQRLSVLTPSSPFLPDYFAGEVLAQAGPFQPEKYFHFSRNKTARSLVNYKGSHFVAFSGRYPARQSTILNMTFFYRASSQLEFQS